MRSITVALIEDMLGSSVSSCLSSSALPGYGESSGT